MALPRLRAGFETLIPRFDPDDVTSHGVEVDPLEAGLAQDDVDAIWRATVGAYQTGLYPAIGLCIRRRGRVVLDRAIGHASGNAPDDPRDGAKVLATPKTLFNLFSASKMVTAMLIHLLDQRRLLHLDDPVAHYLPEFARHGKDRISIRHVLTHRAGIPQLPPELTDVEILQHPEQILEILCNAQPTWHPGRRLAYHALTGGYVLAAIIERITGRDVRTLLRDEILAPLGFDAFNYGVPASRISEVAVNAFTGPAVIPPLSQIMHRVLGVPYHDAISVSNDPRFLQAIVPAGNIICSANEASRFMQLLLDDGTLDGVQIFEPRTVIRATLETSYLEADLTLGLPIRYGMGFMLGSRLASIYGINSARAYGHLGFTNVFAYADPERDIAVAILTSGKPFISPSVARTLWLLQVIARRCPRDWGRGP